MNLIHVGDYYRKIVEEFDINKRAIKIDNNF